jgi:hypothetical protein
MNQIIACNGSPHDSARSDYALGRRSITPVVSSGASKFWRELMPHYPQAKLIHAAPDPEQWFESTQATIFPPNAMSLGGEGPFAAFFAMVSSGFTGRMHDRDFMIDHSSALAKPFSLQFPRTA